MAEATDLLSPGDVARLAGITAATVRVHALKGRMPREALRLAGHRVWRRADIERWLRERRRQQRARRVAP